MYAKFIMLLNVRGTLDALEANAGKMKTKMPNILAALLDDSFCKDCRSRAKIYETKRDSGDTT